MAPVAEMRGGQIAFDSKTYLRIAALTGHATASSHLAWNKNESVNALIPDPIDISHRTSYK